MSDLQMPQCSVVLQRYHGGHISEPILAAVDGENQEPDLASAALSESAAWKLDGGKTKSQFLARECARTATGIRQLYRGVSQHDRTELVECLLTNNRLLHSVTSESSKALSASTALPRVFDGSDTSIPRTYLAIGGYLRAVNHSFKRHSFLAYINALQQRLVFDIQELWTFKPLLQLRLLQRLLEVGNQIAHKKTDATPLDRNLSINLSNELETIIGSFRAIDSTNWDLMFEKLSVTERILRKDPERVYAQMEPASRDFYRGAIADLAAHSNCTESEIADLAVWLAWEQSTSGAPAYMRHVGYFLVDEGRTHLRNEIGYRGRVSDRIREYIQVRASVTYLLAIAFTTFTILACIMLGLGRSLSVIGILALLLIPAVGASVDIVNQLISLVFPPKILPKLDFSKGIPPECLTVVAIPALLLNEKHTRQMVDALEVRFLGNRDRNLHFALLTDCADSPDGPANDTSVVRLCTQLIERLNKKYALQSLGTFFHFHRHQVYSAAEGTWMGWERKRGKLLDFNSFLRGEHDAFPVKSGDLSLLNNVRYVITLDADTQLPRDVARRLIGTLAHPLNRAVFDPAKNMLKRGYAILQPKAGVDLQAARKSRIAAIFSADATFDVYTRAISDAYQDLFGEGNFVGKGIYDVDAFHRLLDTRLPENALLSHDLIEGSFARAALVSDIEILEDYPSRYTVFSRRKHRWVRGDWQTSPWMFPRVADRFGRALPNSLQAIARWKIVDNLRRAVFEPVIVTLLIAGWLVLPGGPLFWTSVVLLLVLLPSTMQLAIALAKVRRYSRTYLKSAFLAFATEQVRVALFFAMLLHQALVMIDAAARTLYRMAITRKKLLEWETAAQAELNSDSRSIVDKYLLWVPWSSFVLAGAICLLRPAALPVALPFLMAWFLSGQVARWLDGSWSRKRSRLPARDRDFLRGTALRTWRFFHEFSGPANHWLIPDRLQEAPSILVERLSPTNLGLLLNARLAAFDFGLIGLPEFIDLCEATLSTVSKLPKHNGHLYNWYDSRSLQPEPPLFISTVDSGNLACSFLTMSQGCLQMADQPLLSPALWQGIGDRVKLLHRISHNTQSRPAIAQAIASLEQRVFQVSTDEVKRWVAEMPALEADARALEKMVRRCNLPDLLYWSRDLSRQARRLRQLAATFAPWLTLKNASFTEQAANPHPIDPRQLTLETAPKALQDWQNSLLAILERPFIGAKDKKDIEHLLRANMARLQRARCLRNMLQRIGRACEDFAEQMDFRFLYNRRRKLLSIGYTKSAERLESACYDLLASEARIAAFVAIAKGDIPQESWFYLGRGQTRGDGEKVLISWAGSLFEYLMPTLWMRSYSGTLLEVSARVAVRAHRQIEFLKGHPWGISEAAYNKREAHGLFEYDAFGAPPLSLRRYSTERTVISAYSTFMSLSVDTQAALKNLYRMRQKGWAGRYGFYESAEIRVSKDGQQERKTQHITHCWMAHHQGMILLSLCNVLMRSPMHRRFHSVPMIAATDRLLHEKMPTDVVITEEFAAPNLNFALHPTVQLAPNTVS